MINFFLGLQNPIQPHNMRLMHDNATPHTARTTQTFIVDNNIRLLRQPPYSPDINLCDNYIFPRLEVKSQNFNSADDLRQFLREQLPLFTGERMTKALQKSVETMRKIVDVNGAYV